MNRTENLAGAQAGQFRTTNWSVVLLSAQSQLPGSQSALADLCRLYWYPLYAFVRRRGYGTQDAEDLTQSFFLSLLERKSLRKANPEKGKFRSFLLASLKNYLIDTFDRAKSVKRGGHIEFVGLDLESGEERYLGEAAGGALNAESAFDARWAMTLLTYVMDRLREEYVGQGKVAMFNTLQPFLDPANSKELPSYEEVAEKLQTSLGGAKTLIHRFRKRHSEILREEVSRTVSDPETVDEEIHALCEALIASDRLI
ncbi:MAG: sigma-70 family RNA polymerase sigma factor [Verrucomicrobia bacterium]|nr:sigma-70 family RNA polymerase sigma factor [Verrucomicrobiota bacterium]MBV8279272.1 sigma-70 family RNA polymerase sigma factor [Verrucomicrobiota bacterium]